MHWHGYALSGLQSDTHMRQEAVDTTLVLAKRVCACVRVVHYAMHLGLLSAALQQHYQQADSRVEFRYVFKLGMLFHCQGWVAAHSLLVAVVHGR